MPQKHLHCHHPKRRRGGAFVEIPFDVEAAFDSKCPKAMIENTLAYLNDSIRPTFFD